MYCAFKNKQTGETILEFDLDTTPDYEVATDDLFGGWCAEIETGCMTNMIRVGARIAVNCGAETLHLTVVNVLNNSVIAVP